MRLPIFRVGRTCLIQHIGSDSNSQSAAAETASHSSCLWDSEEAPIVGTL